jgi:hypothetical protein
MISRDQLGKNAEQYNSMKIFLPEARDHTLIQSVMVYAN